MIRNKPLSEKSYKMKCIAYIAFSVTWVIIAAVTLHFNSITQGEFGLSPTFVAIAISTIFHTRHDSLCENYALHKKISTQD